MVFFTYNLMGDFMKLSELQDKDVVNIKDGKKIGNIADAILDNNGNLSSLIILKSKLVFYAKDEINIKWEQIKKIGEDVILVEANI